MPENFSYDVFLSHRSKDKEIVRPIAERLKNDGLKVWFDEWSIKAGDNIPHKIEEGLEHSRVLVLCMSANAFGSDWAELESGTFRFRDPLNRERCFIPLRLDDAPIKDSLAQFLYINWLPEDRDQAYAKLREGCRPPVKPAVEEALAALKPIAENAIQLDYENRIWNCVFSPDGRRALTGDEDGTVRLWDVMTGRSLHVFEGHTGDVNCLAWSADQRRALSSSWDYTMRLWDVETGRCLRVFDVQRRGYNWSLSLSADQCRVLTGDIGQNVKLWDLETGRCLRVFEGHGGTVFSLAWSP